MTDPLDLARRLRKPVPGTFDLCFINADELIAAADLIESQHAEIRTLTEERDRLAAALRAVQRTRDDLNERNLNATRAYSAIRDENARLRAIEKAAREWRDAEQVTLDGYVSTNREAVYRRIQEAEDALRAALEEKK